MAVEVHLLTDSDALIDPTGESIDSAAYAAYYQKALQPSRDVILLDADGNFFNTLHLDSDGIVAFLPEGGSWYHVPPRKRIAAYSVHADPDIEAAEKRLHNIRAVRASVLARGVDTITPVFWNVLSTDKKQEVTTFRQQWLDYPSTGVKPPIEIEGLNIPNVTEIRDELREAYDNLD